MTRPHLQNTHIHSHALTSRCPRGASRAYPRASWQRARICQTRTDAGVIVPSLGRRERAFFSLAPKRGYISVYSPLRPRPRPACKRVRVRLVRRNEASCATGKVSFPRDRNGYETGIPVCFPARMHHAAHFTLCPPFLCVPLPFVRIFFYPAAPVSVVSPRSLSRLDVARLSGRGRESERGEKRNFTINHPPPTTDDNDNATTTTTRRRQDDLEIFARGYAPYGYTDRG